MLIGTTWYYSVLLGTTRYYSVLQKPSALLQKPIPVLQKPIPLLQKPLPVLQALNLVLERPSCPAETNSCTTQGGSCTIGADFFITCVHLLFNVQSFVLPRRKRSRFLQYRSRLTSLLKLDKIGAMTGARCAKLAATCAQYYP